jgi:hypothetical protein
LGLTFEFFQEFRLAKGKKWARTITVIRGKKRRPLKIGH